MPIQQSTTIGPYPFAPTPVLHDLITGLINSRIIIALQALFIAGTAFGVGAQSLAWQSPDASPAWLSGLGTLIGVVSALGAFVTAAAACRADMPLWTIPPNEHEPFISPFQRAGLIVTRLAWLLIAGSALFMVYLFIDGLNFSDTSGFPTALLIGSGALLLHNLLVLAQTIYCASLTRDTDLIGATIGIALLAVIPAAVAAVALTHAPTPITLMTALACLPLTGIFVSIASSKIITTLDQLVGHHP